MAHIRCAIRYENDILCKFSSHSQTVASERCWMKGRKIMQPCRIYYWRYRTYTRRTVVTHFVCIILSQVLPESKFSTTVNKLYRRRLSQALFNEMPEFHTSFCILMKMCQFIASNRQRARAKAFGHFSTVSQHHNTASVSYKHRNNDEIDTKTSAHWHIHRDSKYK